MKVALDTNVIVSAFINTNGTPAKILSLVLGGKIKMLYDNRILFEYYDVLSRKEFGFDSETIRNMMDFFKHEGEFVNAEPVTTKFADETDIKFYEVSKTGDAQYLITGNIKHFPKDDSIITPKEFLEKWLLSN